MTLEPIEIKGFHRIGPNFVSKYHFNRCGTDWKYHRGKRRALPGCDLPPSKM